MPKRTHSIDISIEAGITVTCRFSVRILSAIASNARYTVDPEIRALLPPPGPVLDIFPEMELQVAHKYQPQVEAEIYPSDSKEPENRL